MKNIEALKKLAAVVCGVKETEVEGATNAEVINFIANNYPTTKETTSTKG